MFLAARNIKRWVGPTLREIRKRKQLVGPEKAVNRTSFTDWNPNAELYAFSKRLSEDFQLPVLQKAFMHASYITQETARQKELGIEEPSLDVQDNQPLIECGSRLLNSYVASFINDNLSSAPGQLKTAVTEYLVSNAVLAKLARNLGATTLILSSEFPVQEDTLANTFRAIVAALSESSGEARTNAFIHDFVCTQLSQLDWTQMWTVDNPFEELTKVCETEKLGTPEARLIGSCGTNTLLASYNVGVYCDQKMIGAGFGENVDIAIAEASADALRGLYKIRTHQQFVKF